MREMKLAIFAGLSPLIGWKQCFLVLAHKEVDFCKEAGQSGHLRQFWGASFPYNGNKMASVCDGKVTVKKDGQICVVGHVSYADLREAVPNPILAPSNDEITVAGHILSGSPHWWRGTELTYAIDYITSYTVNGTTYQADKQINDRLFAASRGTIDGICFDSSFAKEEYFYSISHKIWPQRFVNTEALLKGQFMIISNLFAMVEFLEETEKPLVAFGSWLLRLQGFFASSVFGGRNIDDNHDNEDTTDEVGFFDLIPVTMNSFAPIGRVWVNGPTSSATHPSPTIGTSIESIQIDTEWTTLQAAVEDGLFTKYGSPPKEIYVAIKKLEPGSENPMGCWISSSADISFGGVRGKGKLMDEYVNKVVYPVLVSFGGTVGIHVGKRIPADADVTRAALRRYADTCGVEIGLEIEPNKCFHPLCRRTETPTNFTYPSKYYVPVPSILPD